MSVQFPPIPQLPGPTPGPTTAPLEDRRGTVSRIEAQSGEVFRVQGLFHYDGAGEASVEVNFPVWFIEHPFPTFGGELAPNQSPTAGEFPTVSVVVLGWKMQDYPGGVSYYIGAYLGVVTTGPADQKMLVSWQVEGKALNNPIGDPGTPDGTI